jgi:hypothetical protein
MQNHFSKQSNCNSSALTSQTGAQHLDRASIVTGQTGAQQSPEKARNHLETFLKHSVRRNMLKLLPLVDNA